MKSPAQCRAPAPMSLAFLKKLLPEKEAVHCRYCGSADVRPSHKSPAGARHAVYRCRACKQHFKVALGRRLPIPAMLGTGAFLAVIATVVLGFFLSAGSGPAEDAQLVHVDAPERVDVTQLTRAARGGKAQAQYELGRVYSRQEAHREAFPWLEAAAAQGHADAQFLLGTLYMRGQGTVQNYRAALEQFTLAAERGHLEAQYQLGLFHRDGMATAPSKETAYVWLNLAAARGHAEAQALRDKLMLAMTGEEIARGQEASASMHQRFSGPLETARR